ncbi:SRPBCC family protein [Sneathiella litorea]|uniref:SRPBCC domain-containing protein n=1 Tax=Sneathiella litorea TaxID=2606216 RepID=A0A6L8WCU9_9PROT|nr:SRPBCC domain-containing protein [Sneathiella litorea]MZR31957.1 SRPBCC domain-containing protein [Sneathiella litorea]
MSTLKMERTFSADPATVFSFLTQPQNILKWWGPEGMTVPEHNLDFSKPGKWMSVMVNAEGGRYKVTGEVIKVDPPRSVELTWGWHDENDSRGHESHVRLEVEPSDTGGAVFRLIHSDLPDDESAANHEQGWTSALNKLERLLS